jgi:hypothetical protein
VEAVAKASAMREALTCGDIVTFYRLGIGNKAADAVALFQAGQRRAGLKAMRACEFPDLDVYTAMFEAMGERDKGEV